MDVWTGTYDLADAGLDPITIWVELSRNLAGSSFPIDMTKEGRLALEDRFRAAFTHLESRTGFEGKYYSLSPGQPHYINQDDFKKMVCS